MPLARTQVLSAGRTLGGSRLDSNCKIEVASKELSPVLGHKQTKGGSGVRL